MNILAINKPKGMTSHDVVNKVRKASGVKKVGHAGTLDPLATGVLVIAIGREATRTINEVVKKEKEYHALITLGFVSTTDDEEGIKTKISEYQPSLKSIEKVLKDFVGTISQIPPAFSAVKINGKEAYKYARANKTIELKARDVEVKSIEIISYQYPILELKITTGPGVYIRSLARDIGKVLKTGAYMSSLVRTRVGEFVIEKSITLEDLQSNLGK